MTRRQLLGFTAVSLVPANVLAAADDSPRIKLPDDWISQTVRQKDRRVGLLGIYVKPMSPDRAQLLVWEEMAKMPPDEIALQFVEKTHPGEDVDFTIERRAVPAPDALVSYTDNKKNRQGVAIFRKMPDGRVITFDADFAPEHHDAIVAQVKIVAARAF